MLQTLRNNTQVILWVTILAFVGLIVLVWGADFQTGKQGQIAAGTVNGQTIPRAVFDEVYRNNLQNYRNSQDREMTYEDQRRLAEQSWNAVVSDYLVDQQADDLRLPVSDDEVVFWIQNNPPAVVQQNPSFQDENGNFDHQRYLASLRTNPEAWVGFENSIRQSLPSTKLQQIVLNSAKVSRGEVEEYINQLSEQRVISYARVDPATVEFDDTSISDSDVEAYYKSHLDDYQTGEQATLRYVKIDKTPSEQDIAEVLEDCVGYAAEVRRDLAAGVDKGRATFSALVINFSDGRLAESGGDAGPARTRDQIRPNEVAEKVFATAVGQVSDPFKIDNRYYMVFVTSENDEGARTYLNLVRDITAGAEQLTEIRRQVVEIFRQAGDGLDKAAAAAGVTVEETKPFSSTGFVPELLQFRDTIQFAFANDPGTLGGPDQSETSWLIYEVGERLESEPLPFEQVKASVRRAVADEQKRDIARNTAREFAQAVSSKGFESGAKSAGLEIQQSARFARSGPISSIGADAPLVNAAFELADGGVSELIEGDTGFYVVRADSVITATETELDGHRQTARLVLEQERQYQVIQSWLETLRASADIEDKRQGVF